MTTTHKKRRPSRRTRPSRIYMVQATRAIYIDFENLPFEQPSLLGYVCEGKWTIAIIEPELAKAAEWEVPGGTVTACTADAMLTAIRNRAESELRGVCAWSEHDLRMIKRIYADQPEKSKWWQDNLVDIRPQALQFVRRYKYPVTPIVDQRTGRESTLHQSVTMASLGIKVPEKYGQGVAAAGIAALRSALANVDSIDVVDDATKDKWIATLLHNRYDCFGMAAIMCPVTRGPGQTLLESKWLMDPYFVPFEPYFPFLSDFAIVDPPHAEWRIDAFASEWSGYNFFYGITYTDCGWAITEFHDYGSNLPLMIPVEISPDLWAACERAEMENIAMGLVPSYGWRSSNEI